jgi:membrane dipeptidase
MSAEGSFAVLLLGAAIALVGCKPSSEGQHPMPTASAVVSAAAPTALPPEPSSTAAVPTSAPLGPPRAIDMHCDTPYQVKTKGRSLALDTGHITPDTLRRGQVGGVFFAIYIADTLHDNHPKIADADAIVETVDQIVARHPDILWPATSGPTPDGKVTAFLSIEGAGAFADDVAQIDRFIARGVRLVGPVHLHNNRLATSSTEKHTGGLTSLGKTFCERVYRKGALVDVSHMSDESFKDLVAVAARFQAPIVATHSDARALADHPRNLTDDQLRAIAKSGGVVGVNFYTKYLRIDAEATLADAVRHAMHMVKVAGVDHVGIGSDFDGATTPKDLADASYLPAFAAGLQDAGLSAADVHKVFSENVKRVLSWKPGDGDAR